MYSVFSLENASIWASTTFPELNSDDFQFLGIFPAALFLIAQQTCLTSIDVG